MIVFDDAELLGVPGALGFIEGLLGARLERLRVAVASRRPLELRVGPAQLDGRLTVLGAGDLAFTAEEIASLLTLRRGAVPPPSEVAELLATTEGWPLGVALSARFGLPTGGDDDPDALRRTLFDYLKEELLDSVKGEERRALLASAVVEEISPATERALGLPHDFARRTNRDGRATAARREGRARWHPLMLEFLRGHVAQELSDVERRALHARAADAVLEQAVVRRLGILEAAGVHRHREALLLDPGLGGVSSAQQARELAGEGGQPTGRLRRDHPAVGGGPALVAVLPQHEQLPTCLAHRVADRVETPQREHLAGRAAGDHGDTAHLSREGDQHVGGVGVDVRVLGVLDDGRQGAVEVEPDEEVVGRADQGGVLLLAGRRDELHGAHAGRWSRLFAPHPVSSCPDLRKVRSGGSPVVVVGEDDRDPVEAERFLGRLDLPDPQVATEGPAAASYFGG